MVHSGVVNNGPMAGQPNFYSSTLYPVLSTGEYTNAYILSYGPNGGYIHSSSPPSHRQTTAVGHWQHGSASNQYEYNVATTSTRKSPRSLLLMCIGLICLQCLTSVLWLSIYPPRALSSPESVYRCVSTSHQSAFSLVDTDSISSLLFVSLLLLITIYFALLCWRQPVNQHECRWILLSSYLTAMFWLCWALVSKLGLVHDRDLSIAITNFMVACVMFLCLFVRKVFAFERLRRQLKSKTFSSPNTGKNQGKRKLGPFTGAFSRYGTLGSTNDNTNSNQGFEASNHHGLSKDLPDNDKMSENEQSRAESIDNLDTVSTISGMTTTSSIISSVRGYFKGHQRNDSRVSASAGNVEKNGTNRSETKSKSRPNRSSNSSILNADFVMNEKKRSLSSESAAATLSGNGLGPNTLLGLHLAEQRAGQSMQDPLAAELYPMDVYDAGQPKQGNAKLNAKNELFNSNRSLYLMDENGFM